MNLYLALSLPILLGTLWIYTAHIIKTSLPRLTNKRICLLIAHPDDEAMFFAPTVLALTAPELGNHLKILCLSSGDADHLGHVRKKELLDSATMLGLRSPNDVFIIEDADNFPDSMALTWDAQKIARLLAFTFGTTSASQQTSQSPTSPPTTRSQKTAAAQSRETKAPSPPASSIDILLTFDSHGISGHKNHISLFHGARAWLQGLMKGKEGWDCPVDLYTLTSVNIVRKYISVLDAPFSLARGVVQGLRKKKKNKNNNNKQRRHERLLLFVSDFRHYRTAQRAMTRAHQSQMRWFRWGWIGVGRYMVVNELRREGVV